MSVREASALLGVAESTLRRWADAGQVPVKRTLGGHRRFSLAGIARLAGTLADGNALAHSTRPRPSAFRLDQREVARQDWHKALAAQPVADRMRSLGQRMLGLLIQYINGRELDERYLEGARDVGATYGREVHRARLPMRDLIQAYVFFRGTFTQVALPLPGVTQPRDLDEMARLQSRLHQFMDAVLVGLIAGYESAGLASPALTMLEA